MFEACLRDKTLIDTLNILVNSCDRDYPLLYRTFSRSIAMKILMVELSLTAARPVTMPKAHPLLEQDCVLYLSVIGGSRQKQLEKVLQSKIQSYVVY